MDDLRLGQPVAWDIYDDREQLLARKGFVPQSETQMETLIRRGLLVIAEEYREAQDLKNDEDNAEEKPQHHVLSMLEHAHDIVQGIMLGFITDMPLPDTKNEVLRAANILNEAFTINPDIAFAWILFKQTSVGYATRHLVNAAVLSMAVAKAMNKPQEETALITAAALTMNISIMRLQEELQNREAGPNKHEEALLRKHPEESAKLLSQVGVTDKLWKTLILDHHEHLDGSGYPSGKSGNAFHDGAQIIALSDRYTSMISPRKYRKALHPTHALRAMLIDGGKTCDAKIAAYFIKELGIYPPGAGVKLVNNECGVVMRKGFSAMAPAVLVVKNQYGAPLPFQKKRDTELEQYAIKEPFQLEPDDIPFSMQQLWGTEAT